MLRLLSYLFDALSALFAVLAPVAVVHWIVGAFGVEALSGLVDTLGLVFTPMNALIDMVLPFDLPSIQYQEREIPITQGLTAFIFTILFFGFALIGHMCRESERQIELSRDLQRYRERARRQEMVRQDQQKRVTSAGLVLVYLLFPFDSQKNAANLFTGFRGHGGRQSTNRAEGWLIEFEDIDRAMRYATTSAERLLKYYGTLRPMDPQPPFQMSIHAINPEQENTFSGLEKCQRLIRFAGDNQIIMSQHILDLMNASQITAETQSMGLYDFANESQEIYQLFYKRPSQKVRY